MLFWNKVEIYCGFSIKEFTDLRDALSVKGINYEYKIINHSSSNKGKFRTLGINHDNQNLYYLYVHQKDYDHAMHHTSNRNL
jgi:hypothetical protein